MDKILSLKNLFILIVILTMFLFLKDDGIIDYQTLLNEHNQLLSVVNEKSDQLFNLKRENVMLQNNDQYIEKIAREKYFYLFPKETIINF